MIISFDLDQTLIPSDSEFKTENRNLFQKLSKTEKIRLGTIELFQSLQKHNHKIWIYTTSYRTKFKIWLSFLTYGIKVNGIINENINQRELKKKNIRASKCPPLFGIDIHIDDSKGVEMEGEKLGFKTIIIDINDDNWSLKIKKELNIC